VHIPDLDACRIMAGLLIMPIGRYRYERSAGWRTHIHLPAAL
jgi:hypothetical protein